jgi:hypothetical protein
MTDKKRKLEEEDNSDTKKIKLSNINISFRSQQLNDEIINLHNDNSNLIKNLEENDKFNFSVEEKDDLKEIIKEQKIENTNHNFFSIGFFKRALITKDKVNKNLI